MANITVSKPVRVEDLTSKSKYFKLEASPEQLKEIAEYISVPEIKSLTAKVALKSIKIKKGRLIEARGSLESELTQSCVVTLEPVSEAVESDFEVLFSTEVVDSAGEELEIESIEGPVMEPVIDGIIDIWELVIQQLSLSMEAYPRAKGAVFEEKEFGGRKNPFDILAELKNRASNED